jgi:GntR family transcriptional regulator/MocR family aminotransferase
MAKKPAGVPVWISLDASSGAPIYHQLYEWMRSEILAGRLPASTRLPSTRTLAAELGASRSTVVTAFEHLLAEGYLEGKVGSGTYVAGSLPEELLGVQARTTNEPGPTRSGRVSPGAERCWLRRQRSR